MMKDHLVGEYGGTWHETENTVLQIIEEKQKILKIKMVSEDIITALK